MTLGSRIKELRLAHEWTQEEVAHRAGLRSRAHISRLEHDQYKKPSGDTLARLTTAFDLRTTELFELAGCMPKAIKESGVSYFADNLHPELVELIKLMPLDMQGQFAKAIRALADKLRIAFESKT